MYIFQLCRGLCLRIVQLRVLQYSIEPPGNLGLSPTAHMYTQPAFPRKLGSSIGLNNISTLQTSFINRQKYVKELANMYIHLHIIGRVFLSQIFFHESTPYWPWGQTSRNFRIQFRIRGDFNPDTCCGIFTYGMYFYGIGTSVIYTSTVLYLYTERTQLSSQVMNKHCMDKIRS